VKRRVAKHKKRSARAAFGIRPDTSMTMEDTPLVDRYLRCSLPVVLVDPQFPEFPGNGGTCFAVRYRGRTVFLTARHVVGTNDPSTIWVPLTFGGPIRPVPLATVGTAAIRDVDDPDWLDVAILVPAEEPTFDGREAAPIDFDIVANLDHVPADCIFAMRGYPKDKDIDYETQQIERTCQSAFGKYVGRASWKSCHTLQMIGTDGRSFDGLSGAPVVRVVIDKQRRWRPALAGLVLRGGNNKLHFVEVRVLHRFLDGLLTS